MLCLFPYQRVFYALASWCPSQKTRDNSKRRGLVACVQTYDTNGKLLSPNHLRSLPAAPHSDLSARQYEGLFQDMMFERLQYSTLSEDASKVIVQPLPVAQFQFIYLLRIESMGNIISNGIKANLLVLLLVVCLSSWLSCFSYQRIHPW